MKHYAQGQTSEAKHTPGPRLSSVQRFVLKEILLDSFAGASQRHYGRTRQALWRRGLLTSTWCGELTDTGRKIAKQELDAERNRRAAIAKATGSAA
jgi:hypothetical protein